MRIICWNVRGATSRSPAWRYLFDCAPDLALLQEVGALPDLIGGEYACRAAFATTKRGTAQRFRTVILVRGKLGTPISLRGPSAWVDAELDRFAGNLVATEAMPDDGPRLNAISVYSPAWPVDRTRLIGVDVTGVRLAQNPDVWVADLLCSALREFRLSESDRWVIAGDFNLSETFDRWRGGPRGNREYLDRMTELGLVECLREFKGDLTPTFRNTDRRTVKHQMDHLFVTKPLAERLVACEVGAHDTIFGENLSDHLPLIADFDDWPEV